MRFQINLQNQQNLQQQDQDQAVRIPVMIQAVQAAAVPILVSWKKLWFFLFSFSDSDSKPIVTKQPSKSNLGATGGFADDDQTILNHLMGGKLVLKLFIAMTCNVLDQKYFSESLKMAVNGELKHVHAWTIPKHVFLE